MSTRLETQRHRLAVLVALVAIVASVAGWNPSTETALAVAALAAVLGLPHGAADIVVGPRLIRPSMFQAAYIGLAAATIAAWFVAPAASLVIFMIISWWHFGSGDAEHHPELGATRFGVGAMSAGLVLGMPLLAHSTVVTPIVDDMVGSRVNLGAEIVSAAGAAMMLIAIACFLPAAIDAYRIRRWRVFVEVSVLAALALVCHPLITFALYFSCWHSPRHVISLQLNRTAIRPALAASAATIVAAAGAWLVLSPSISTTVQVVFIGLSALTTPHLLVTELGRAAAPSAMPSTFSLDVRGAAVGSSMKA